jgi:8-oxo-dGTP pyrophosphatase MutT (NUDIX family)
MSRFNIRVYGILIDSKKRVLVSDECIRGELFTKFPGGGLEFGEGTRECLQREFKEETNLHVTVGAHIYTTDFFQLSAFNKTDQIISIYYFVHASEPIELKTEEIQFNFQPEQLSNVHAEYELFRWISWEALTEDTVSLPIDKKVVTLLKNGNG